MKRPLALFAVSFFAFQLLALNLPQQVLLPIAAVLVCVFFVCIIKKKAALSVFICAAAFAFMWNFVYVNAIVKSNFKYIGETHNALAQVKSTTQYSAGYMYANLEISEIDGNKVSKFNVKANNIPYVQTGEYISLNLTFKPLSAANRLFSYTDGVFLAADYKDGFKSQNKYSIFYYANNVQQYLSGKVQILMPNENGDVASAMTFGDKLRLKSEIKNSFRAAGLSHLLVVSGMHLAAASAIAYALFNFLFKKRQLSAAASIVFIIIFIFVTGITPSALRAGIMLSIAMLGMCFYRKADSFTSISFAGLLMCIYNPFICYDVGFLLSFTATLGVLFSNLIIKKLSETKLSKNKFVFVIIKLAALPVFATLGTMPVLIIFNLGISALGVFFNIVITPLLGVITSLTFIAVILSSASFLMPLAYAAAFINTVIISAVLFITRLADKITWSLIYINGTAAALILVALYVLFYLQIKLKPKYGWLLILIFSVLTISANMIVEANLVKVAPISSRQNSSVLVWTNNKGVLINREKTVDTSQINSFLKQNNVSGLALIIDMHESSEGLSHLNAEKTVNIFDDFYYACSYEPFTDIIVTVKKQEKGSAAFLDLNGFTAVLNNGEYNFENSYYADAYISGISKGVNISADNIITPGNKPKWLCEDNIKHNAKIVAGKNNKYRIYEDFYGFD